MNVARPILDVLESAPGRVAIVEPKGRAIDCRDLRARVLAFTAHLQARGFAPGDRVLVQVPAGIELAVAVLGALLSGGVAVLCEPGLGDAVYLGRVRAAAPTWLLVHPLVAWINRVPGLSAFLKRREIDVPPTPPPGGMTRVPVSAAEIERIAKRPAAPRIVEREAGDDAVLVFTGGTTTAPKGVRLTHEALGPYLGNVSSLVAGESGKTFVADTPQQMLFALRLGWTVHVTRGRSAKRARHVLALLARERIGAYFSSPYVWTEIMAATNGRRPWTGANPARVLLGSAPVTAAFLERLRGYLDPATKVLVVYGLTECGPACAVLAEEKLGFADAGDLVGAPLPGVEIAIEDPRPDGVGEVVIRGPSLYAGYLGEPDRAAGDGLRTGDLGRTVEVGGRPMLALLGRAKDMIVRAGVNIYPASFEPQVRALRDGGGTPLVRECAMVGVWSEARQDEEVVLFIEPERGVQLEANQLRPRVETITGPDAAPDRVIVVPAIPLTGRQNKVDKEALRRMAGATPAGKARG